MKFIELHFTDGSPVLVNLEQVITVNIDRTGVTENTIIGFSGANDNYISVKESYGTVVNKIWSI